MNRLRDVLLSPLSKDKQLAIACDVSAGIGVKTHDQVMIDPAIMAAYALRVALLEVLCLGATPIAVIDTVGNEMHPTGEQVIAGLKQELIKAQLTNVPLSGSTEDNMVTSTTSVGVTVISQVATAQLPAPEATDVLIYQLGTPYVGNAVAEHLDSIFGYEWVERLRAAPGVVDLLPVGSKGIRYEVGEMQRILGKSLVNWQKVADEAALDQSAGPSTVLLVGVRASQQAAFEALVPELKRIAVLTGEKS